MSNAVLLRRCLTSLAQDDGTVCALIDALREDEGMSTLHACVEVARIHNANLDAKQLTTATRLLAARSIFREGLQELIVRAVGGLPEEDSLICLVEGRSPPRRHYQDPDEPLIDQSYAVTVGGGWVCQQHELGAVFGGDATNERGRRKGVRR